MDKVCGICGEDCSDRPRVRDRRGRYFCKSCAEARLERERRVQPRHPESPRSSDPSPDSGDEPLEIDPGARPFPIELVRHVDAVTPCPMCGRSMAPDAKICVHCGFDKDRGIQATTSVGKSTHKGKRGKFCRECGYDLRGLREPVCPECGARIRASKRQDWDDDTARQIVRDEWMKPAITLAVASIAMAALITRSGEYLLFVAYPMFLAVEVLVGFVILLVSFSFLGDLGTPLLNLLRLTAIYTTVDCCSMLIPAFGLYRVGFSGAVFAILFMNFFDVDLDDAWIVVLINWIVKMAIVVGMIVYLQ